MPQRSGVAARGQRPSYLQELVQVLSEHSAGLRRWSVMRAIRLRWERAGFEVPHKFEDEVERAFRSSCAADPRPDMPEAVDRTSLFYRPKERAGEVWAVYEERAQEWLRKQAA